MREGHGDLRAERVLVNGAVRIVDRVEFDRGLRELDVADDLAFLVADLVSLGGERFAELLVREYAAPVVIPARIGCWRSTAPIGLRCGQRSPS